MSIIRYDRLDRFYLEALAYWPMVLNVADKMVSTEIYRNGVAKCPEIKSEKKGKLVSYFMPGSADRFSYLCDYVKQSGIFDEIIQKFDSVPHTALKGLSHDDKSMLILMTFGDWEHEYQCQKLATLARFGIHEAQAKNYMHEGPLQVLAANQVRKNIPVRQIIWSHCRD